MSLIIRLTRKVKRCPKKYAIHASRSPQTNPKSGLTVQGIYDHVHKFISLEHLEDILRKKSVHTLCLKSVKKWILPVQRM